MMATGELGSSMTMWSPPAGDLRNEKRESAVGYFAISAAIKVEVDIVPLSYIDIHRVKFWSMHIKY